MYILTGGKKKKGFVLSRKCYSVWKPRREERTNVVNGSKYIVTLTTESINSDQRQHQVEKLFWALGRIEL